MNPSSPVAAPTCPRCGFSFSTLHHVYKNATDTQHIGYAVPPAVAVPAPEDTIELREALAEFRLASARFATASPFDLDNAMDAVDTASRTVQALFARLRSQVERMTGELVEVRAINKGAAKIHLDQYQELERLKAEQLTPEEAEWALMLANSLYALPERQATHDSLTAKLRLRSLADTPK